MQDSSGGVIHPEVKRNRWYASIKDPCLLPSRDSNLCFKQWRVPEWIPQADSTTNKSQQHKIRYEHVSSWIIHGHHKKVADTMQTNVRRKSLWHYQRDNQRVVKQPDIVVVDKWENTAVVTEDVAIPTDSNIRKKEQGEIPGAERGGCDPQAGLNGSSRCQQQHLRCLKSTVLARAKILHRTLKLPELW